MSDPFLGKLSFGARLSKDGRTRPKAVAVR